MFFKFVLEVTFLKILAFPTVIGKADYGYTAVQKPLRKKHERCEIQYLKGGVSLVGAPLGYALCYQL